MMKKLTRALALLLALVLTLSIIPGNVAAAGEEVTDESKTYVLNRTELNQDLNYQYQSPYETLCYYSNLIYYGKYYEKCPFRPNCGLFTMYLYENDTITKTIPTYCLDLIITATMGTHYRRLNLEDSTYLSSVAGKIRAIVRKGFYINGSEYSSETSHIAAIDSQLASLANRAGVTNLTIGEAITATQCALWKTVHGSVLSFDPFAQDTLYPNFLSDKSVKYATICKKEILKPDGASYYNSLLSGEPGWSEKVNNNIRTVYDYLMGLPSESANYELASTSSFSELYDPEWTLNADGTYSATVVATVDVQLQPGDSLTLTATVNGTNYSASVELINNNQTPTQTSRIAINSIPKNYYNSDIYLTISGYQTVGRDVFLFDAEGPRGSSQTMVAMDSGKMPVFAKVLAQESRVLKINKTTNSGQPIGEIVFDIYSTAPNKDFSQDVKNPAQYTLITDENGRASLNLTQMGLPDGTYWIVERMNDDVIKAVEPPFEVTIPYNGQLDYAFPVKNELKPNPVIYKDIGKLDNNSATAKGSEPDTWIISAKNLADVGSYSRYEITDTLDPRLTYEDNLRVELEDASGNRTTMAASGYTHSYDQATHTLTVALTDTGRTTAADYTMLLVYFDTTVNSDNAQAGDEIPNHAKLTYTNNSETNTKKSDIPKVIVPTIQYGSVTVKKVDGESDTTTLAGAVFDLYKGSVDPSNLEKRGLATVADGTLTIPDLEYGTYYLVETQAPPGYNRLTNPVAVIVDAEKVEITIKNNKGSILPETGGMGTEPFLFSGGLLVAASLLLLLSKKRKTS